MNNTRDFIMIGVAAVIIYISNYFKSLNIWLCIALKVVVFAEYTAILLLVYNVKIKDIIALVFKKKRKGNKEIVESKDQSSEK